MSEENDPYQEMEENYQYHRQYCANGEKHELVEIETEGEEKIYRCSKCGWEDVY